MFVEADIHVKPTLKTFDPGAITASKKTAKDSWIDWDGQQARQPIVADNGLFAMFLVLCRSIVINFAPLTLNLLAWPWTATNKDRLGIEWSMIVLGLVTLLTIPLIYCFIEVANNLVDVYLLRRVHEKGDADWHMRTAQKLSYLASVVSIVVLAIIFFKA